jgi:hypothetical protein
LKYLGVEGKIISKWTFEKWDGNAWIYLAQDRKRW